MTSVIEQELGKKMMSESKFYMGYSRWNNVLNRYETWEESVGRVMNMHREKYADKLTPQLEALIAEAEDAYKNKLVLGAQRALQFGGDQLRKHEARMYNCSVSHVDRAAFFQEAMYLLLCGCGVGFSVQNRHISKLPALKKHPEKKVKVFTPEDSIEGWADCFGVLLSSYFEDGGTFPEYKGYRVHFDLSKIRPKGALISGGFKAPGPEPLRIALQKCENLLDQYIGEHKTVKMSPITAYDFVMHMSDAVLSGGVRRSATICMFDKDDLEMRAAKTGNWFIENPQRGRSNNSVMLLRGDVTREEWAEIMKSVREFGEPGFIFTDNLDFCYNPCVEIGMLPICFQTGESGFQFCNLTETNGGACTSPEILFKAVRAAAILGTLQAGYTNFVYLSDATRRITEREALIGVSITGWMNNPHVLFQEANMVRAAEIVKEVNKKVAKLIGIRQAARTTCAKPSGNASVILGTESGIHGAHSNRYIRNVQMNEQDAVLHAILNTNPKMVEKSVWSANGTDYVVSFPVVSNPEVITKRELLGVNQLEYVKLAQQYWVEAGTNEHLSTDRNLRHNISNTISVDDWDEVEQYIYDNMQWFAGISLLTATGDKDYNQAPFTEVLTADEIHQKYGSASMFASGLIVDGLHAFGDNLWTACMAAMGHIKYDDTDSKTLLNRDWIRRAVKFANEYFDGDIKEMTYCLKDVYNLHKWEGIVKNLKPIDFTSALTMQSYVDVDTMGSVACSGDTCEVTF